MRTAVVGGGIVGLATARLLAASGHEVLLLEKEDALAKHQTAHNSGVVHAGIYYAPGSLKARLCRRGMTLLRTFCSERRLPYEECGKVVVATAVHELEPLRRLAERAEQNGVPGLRWLEESQLRVVEPHARGVAALESPATAITDFAQVAGALAHELRQHGGTIRTGIAVTRVATRAGGAQIELVTGEGVDADRVVVCAGLQADRLARASGQPPEPRIVPFRGEYWQLAGDAAELVRGLIYPVPDPRLPFLGVHLTRQIGGGVLLGPNAVLAGAREGYGRGRISVRDLTESLAWPGTLRMMRCHWRAGVSELSRSLRKELFLRDARRYVPELRAQDAMRAPAGIRAQAIDRDGTLVDDFRLTLSGRVAWVRNAPSPAATSSLALAEELASAIGA